MTKTYTQNIRLAKPDFRSPGWADDINANFDALDAAIRNVLMNVIAWAPSTLFGIGQVVYDTAVNPAQYWINNVSHTSLPATTFAAERLANPTYWTAFSFGVQAKGAWGNNTSYVVNDIAYDSVRGVTGICKIPHVSNASGSILDDAVDWNFIVNLPTVFTATATNYDNSVSHLAGTNVQTAIDGVNAAVTGAYVSSNTTYDHTISGLTSNNVKAAIDELKAMIDATNVNTAANTTAITTGTIATGFLQFRPTTETITGWILANGTTIGNAGSGATQRANADCAGIFAWHWNNFSNTQCAVSTGRGANAAVDFAALKTITVLDLRGTGIMGIDTMSGSTTTRLTSVPVTSGSATTAGSVLGENLHTLTAVELAAHLHAVFAGVETHTHGVTQNANINNSSSNVTGGANPVTGGGAATITITAAATGMTVRDTASGGGTANQTAITGNGTSHNTVARIMTGSWYLKQ